MCFTVEVWFPGYGRRDCLPFAMSEWTARQLLLPCRWALSERYLTNLVQLPCCPSYQEVYLFLLERASGSCQMAGSCPTQQMVGQFGSHVPDSSLQVTLGWLHQSQSVSPKSCHIPQFLDCTGSCCAIGEPELVSNQELKMPRAPL